MQVVSERCLTQFRSIIQGTAQPDYREPDERDVGGSFRAAVQRDTVYHAFFSSCRAELKSRARRCGHQWST